MTRPASSLAPASYAHCWAGTWSSLLTGWLGFGQVGLEPPDSYPLGNINQFHEITLNSKASGLPWREQAIVRCRTSLRPPSCSPDVPTGSPHPPEPPQHRRAGATRHRSHRGTALVVVMGTCETTTPRPLVVWRVDGACSRPYAAKANHTTKTTAWADRPGVVIWDVLLRGRRGLDATTPVHLRPHTVSRTTRGQTSPLPLVWDHAVSLLTHTGHFPRVLLAPNAAAQQ